MCSGCLRCSVQLVYLEIILVLDGGLVECMLVKVLSIIFIISTIVVVGGLIGSGRARSSFSRLCRVVARMSRGAATASSLSASRPRRAARAMARPTVAHGVSGLHRVGDSYIN